MGKKWKWDDLLAAFLVLATFASILLVIPLVRIDPSFKTMKAREDCQTLARAIMLLPRLRLQGTGKGESWATTTTLLYTWKGASDLAGNIDRWPRVSQTIGAWRYYSGAANHLGAGFQNVSEFLRDFQSDHKSEQDLLLRTSFTGFDPWGRPYLINIGNMRKKEQIESGFVLLTWAISAGKNGIIETPDYVPSDLYGKDTSQVRPALRGDDIGCVIAARFQRQ